MREIDRRAFLHILSAAGGTAAFRGAGYQAGSALRVDAEATVFYAQPDGQRVLVRFFVTGAEAPGGRLRVFDRARRLVGTAGVIPLGDGRLYGELWVPLTGTERIESELVVPGRAPIRSGHSLTPRPRWRLYWTTAVGANALLNRLRELPPLRRAAQVGLWTSAGVTIDPLPADLSARMVDHLPFLRVGQAAQDVEWELGLPRNAMALLSAEALDHPALAIALNGSGIRYAASRDVAEPAWVVSPDGSRLIVAPLYGGARPTDLGFAEGGAEVLRRVERWIGTLPAPPGNDGIALVAGTTLDDASPEILRATAEWNSRLAFPQILLGSSAEYFRQLERRGSIRATRQAASRAETVPERASELAELARARNDAREHRARAMTTTLGGLDGIASRLAFALPGTLVFNPSPFTRTGLVRLTDGTERMVTDVPALGYAFVPHTQGGDARWKAMERDARASETVLENAHVRLELDAESGAMRSLVSRPDGTEWARAGGSGLNAIEAGRVERIARLELPGTAQRLVIDRWTPGRGAVRSTITLYDAVPRVDLENVAEAVGDVPPQYTFDLPMESASVEWEVSGGMQRARAPAGPFAALRWVRLSGPPGSALFSSPEVPFATVTASGTVAIPGPRGAARISLALRPANSYPPRDDPWRFGWSGEPFLTAAVTGHGNPGLPSFGSLLDLDEPGISVLGFESRGSGRALIYFQELLGLSRRFLLRGGVLSFEEARLADLLGLPGQLLPPDGDAVAVQLPAYGVVAVMLHGVAPRRA